MSSPPAPDFAALGLPDALLQALAAVGYEAPSPIQAQIIPHLLAGRDVLGQAQTGTGKTAAFALPLLARLDLKRAQPQILVLAPTRELAIQVAEAFQRYAAKLPGFHVLPVYGGQSYELQLRPLKRGVHAVVGTPGRVMDHIRRGTLKLDALQCLVLDEADEMLRMGFIDDVEWIMEQTPAGRQVALFSATMPAPIKRIAQRHLKDAQEVTIDVRTRSADTIRQRAWIVSGLHKLDALTRILEHEAFDGMLVFARTKLATVELADKLQARGHAAVAINGDMEQKHRERTVEQFKRGLLDILVATDVVARGIDVDRVSHVINYDIPHDTESYVHRIGRTGRAGRSGDAILFVAPRERRMLAAIERATQQKITLMDVPTPEQINDKRVERFKQKVSDTLQEGTDIAFFRDLVTQMAQQQAVAEVDIAAALAKLVQGKTPLLLAAPAASARPANAAKAAKAKGPSPAPRPDRPASRPAQASVPRAPQAAPTAGASAPPRREPARSDRAARPPSPDHERYRLEVGSAHGAQAGNIIGAIANEAGLDAVHIGKLEIFADHSLIELPLGMPRDIFRDLKKVWVAGQQLKISRLDAPAAAAKPAKHKPRSSKKKGPPRDQRS